MPDGPAMPTEPTTRPPRTQRLQRSRTDRVIGGVCGGIGEYLDVDPVVVRIIAVVLALLNGVGLVLYLAAWLIMPEAPAGGPTEEAEAGTQRNGDAAGIIVGAVLIGVGGMLLIDRLIPGMLRTFGRITWPLALIGIGTAILLHRR